MKNKLNIKNHNKTIPKSRKIIIFIDFDVINVRLIMTYMLVPSPQFGLLSEGVTFPDNNSLYINA